MSNLRETINSDDFINSIFTPEEKERILTTHIASGGDEYFDRDGGPETDDRLFIPDSTEIETYFPEESSRGFEDTSYWLRTASFVVPFMEKVSMTGSYSHGEAYELSGVRLMMWVKKGSYKPSAGDLEDPSKPSGSDDKTASSDTTENSQENSGQDKEQGGSGSGSSGGRASSGNGSSEREGREYADGLKSNLETPEVGARYHFASVEAAKPALEAGLAEYRAYLKGDTSGQYTQQIENRYINHYLIPYLEVLQQNQLLIDPDSVDSKWFSEENTSMSDKVAGGSYENIYKKYAQDMIPYMLPDPDVMLHNVFGVFKSHGMTADPEDKQINAAKILEAYNNYDPKWYESNWSTDWQKLNRDFHYCYSGDAYRASGDGISASISFTSPKYNERYYINANVFGTDDDENFMTIAP